MNKVYNVSVASVVKKLFIVEHLLDDLSFVDEFKSLIEKNISDLSYKTNVLGKMTDWKFFVDNKKFHNILKNSMDMCTFVDAKLMYLHSAWGNILQNNDEVKPHSHQPALLSGILYLTENGPGTDFPDFKKTTEEKIGKFVLFHPHSLHGVKQSSLKEKRYSLAFNLYATNYWE